MARVFQKHLTDSMEWREDIHGLSFVSLSPEEVGSLEVAFREEEVFIALNELNEDKAPGLDGFSLAFW